MEPTATSGHAGSVVEDSEGLVEINRLENFFLGPIAIWRNLAAHTYLVWNFIQRDLRLKYRNSAFGYFWSLLEPLLLAGVYYILFIVIAGKTEKNYPLWVIVGVIVWTFFTRSLNGSITSLTKNAELIKQAYFPREIFAITTVGANLVIALLSLFVAVPFMIYLDISPNRQLLLVPVGLLLAAALALGLGLMFSCLNAVNRDIEHFFRFLTRAGLFLSPVMWTIEMLPASRARMIDYLMLNPMVVPITMVRNGIDGRPLGLETFQVAYAVIFSLLSLLLGAMVFRRYEAVVAKKL